MSLRSRLSAVPRFYIDIAYLFIAEVLVVGLYMYKGLLPVYINTYVRDPRVVPSSVHRQCHGILAIVAVTLQSQHQMALVLCWGVTVPLPDLAFGDHYCRLHRGQFLFSLTAASFPVALYLRIRFFLKQNRLSALRMVSSCASILSPTLGGFTRRPRLTPLSSSPSPSSPSVPCSPCSYPRLNPNHAEAVSVGEEGAFQYEGPLLPPR